MVFNRHLSKIASVLLIAIVCIGLTGCTAGTSVAETESLHGVGFSPRSNKDVDSIGFFAKAEITGEVVSWTGDWASLSDATSAPYVVASQTPIYHLEPIIILSVSTDANRKLIRPLTPNTEIEYMNGLTQFLTKYPVRHLGIGVEVNLLARNLPAEFDQFVSLFNRTVDLVKNISPSTQVFTTFQLEQMKGLRDGLFGGKRDTLDTDWKLIERFTKADAIGFTTYPGLIYKGPSEIPETYYSEIATYTSKPIIFSEVGWFRTGPRGWESSEKEQTDFITAFNKLTMPLKPAVKIWSFLFDQTAPIPFDSMGLLTPQEDTSTPWQTWAGK